MNRSEQINDYIIKKSPDAVCDDCIAKSLALPRRQQAAQVTQALATTSDFDRGEGLCSICGDGKVVIRAR